MAAHRCGAPAEGAIMKMSSKPLAVATLAAVMASPSVQAQPHNSPEGTAPNVARATGPLKAIYRVAGVTDSGQTTATGTATVFHCTNMSSADEVIRVQIRTSSGFLWRQEDIDIQPLRTWTISTHVTAVFFDNLFLNTGILDQGSAHISATHTNIYCSAMIVDAEATVPQGIALHLVRFNPHPGTQE
jgi:hypothetical protein